MDRPELLTLIAVDASVTSIATAGVAVDAISAVAVDAGAAAAFILV